MMINTPFFTLLDPQAKIKGSRDPLGLQPLWTSLGRQVVRNLTTVTTSLRGFSVLILGLYFSERAIAEKNMSPEKMVELFLKFEQLAAYSRVAVQTAREGEYTEDEIRGIQRVKKNLLGKRVWISAGATSQILSNQRTYGLWGLYTVAARNSNLIEPDAPRLTQEARAFVAAQYDNPKQLTTRESEQILGFLCKDQWFEPTGKDTKLARKLAELLGKKLTPDERNFYRKHLIECGADEHQSTLWHAMRKVTRAKHPFAMDDLRALRKHIHTNGHDELAKRLSRIQVAESVFGPAAHAFNFVLTCDGRTIEKAASDIKKTWGANLRQIDPEAFTQVLDTLGGRADHTMRMRLANLAVSLANGRYQQALELLIDQNKAVMQTRGGSEWVALKADRVSVRFHENAVALPVRDELPDLWTNTYFLNSLKLIGYQVDGGAQ